MRLIKMFGLAALAVGIVMAFVGATSAMAVTELEKVVLCDEMVADNNASVCPTGHDFLTGTVLHAKLAAGEAVLNGGFFGSIKCKQSTTLGETTELLAHGKITELTFSECKFGLTNCENPEVKNLPYLVLTLLTFNEKTKLHEGYHTVVTGIAATPEVHVKCGTSVNCTFSAPAEGVLFTNELEEKGEILTVNQTVNNSGGGFCPTTSIWEAKYLVLCLKPTGTEVPCWPRMEE